MKYRIEVYRDRGGDPVDVKEGDKIAALIAFRVAKRRGGLVRVYRDGRKVHKLSTF